MSDSSTEAARGFWQAHDSPSSVVDSLLAAIAAFGGVGRQTEPRTGQLVRALILTSPYDRRNLIEQIVKQEAAWPFLRPAILATHEVDAVVSENVVRELSESEHSLVRASAVDSIQWMVERTADLKGLIDIARRLSQDGSLIVKAAVARVARRLAKRAPREALSILTNLNCSGDLHVADEVFRSIDPNYGVDPGLLSDADVDTLLDRIETVSSLDGRNYKLLEFIDFASTRRPAQTLAMLLHRVIVTDGLQRGKRGDDRWLPLLVQRKRIEPSRSSALPRPIGSREID